MTFDPREIPLEEFFISDDSQKEIDHFNDVVIFIMVNLETNTRLAGVPMEERYTAFWEEVDNYITVFSFGDRQPFTFKVFQKMTYSHFASFDGTIKVKQIRMTDCKDYYEWKAITKEQVNEALKKVSLLNLDRKSKKFSIFLPKLFFQGEDPNKFYSNHHMTSRLLRQFWSSHDRIFETMATDDEKYKDAIMRHNQRKLMFPNLRTVHENTQGRRKWGQNVVEDEEYREVLRTLQVLPPGLSFRGPLPPERSDDPDNKNNRDKNEKRLKIKIDPDLEEGCGVIVGDNYLKKVIELKQRIEAFLKDPYKTVEKSSKMASRIMGMWVFRDYSKDKIILPWFSYNDFGSQQQWYYNTTIDRWRIKTHNEMNLTEERTTQRPDLEQPGTSGYKKFITTSTTPMPLLIPTVRTIGSLGWELRKKRATDSDTTILNTLREMCDPSPCSWYMYLNLWTASSCY